MKGFTVVINEYVHTTPMCLSVSISMFTQCLCVCLCLYLCTHNASMSVCVYIYVHTMPMCMSVSISMCTQCQCVCLCLYLCAHNAYVSVCVYIYVPYPEAPLAAGCVGGGGTAVRVLILIQLNQGLGPLQGRARFGRLGGPRPLLGPCLRSSLYQQLHKGSNII